MGNNYNLLVEKINEFTRKFYLNRLLRGSMYAAATILTLFVCLYVFTYFAYPSVTTKTILFFLFLIVSVLAFTFWLLVPLLYYLKLNKNLSLEEAANLIGGHFFHVKDRLLNTLQLKALAEKSPNNNLLILAGIDQKISELKPIPFASAINLSDNQKYIKYIFLPLSIILFTAILTPSILKEGTASFIKYDQEILPKAPFQFVVINKNLTVTQGDDLTVKLKLTGDEFPQDIYVQDGPNKHKLEKEDISNFSYSFKNIQKGKIIRFSGGGFSSSAYSITVTKRASLLNLKARLVFPAYLNRKSAHTLHAGDLLIPEGTKIEWTFETEHSTILSFTLGNKLYKLPVKNDQATFSAVIKDNAAFKIIPQNNKSESADSLHHRITVIKDQFPSILIVETPDSISKKAIYFTGSVTDDYGFSSLKFRYQIKENEKIVATGSKSIGIKANQTANDFFYFWDLNTVPLKANQSVQYFFEVADNDGVNGAKVSRSALKTYKALSQKAIAQQIAEGDQSLKEKMDAAIKLATAVEKESKKLNESILDKKELNFEDKKQIEALLAKQKRLDDAIKDIKAQNEKNNFDKQDNNLLSEELKQKQQKIDELFNNVLNEKTKELLQKLQQLMEQNNKDQTREELSKMQMDNKSLKNELDRILELYKQLEFEQNLQNKIDRLNEMAQQQKELAKQTDDNQKPASDLKDKQEKLQSDFKDLKKELQQLDKQNQLLERPNDYKNPDLETNEIEKSQQESKEQLSKNNKQQAAEKQDRAGQQMQDLANKMQQQQQSGAEEENKVNAQELRKLLENLLTTSFEQEKVMLALRKMAPADLGYVAQAQKQNIIRDNMKTIADSLFSLSKRVPQIESTVSIEIEKINFHLKKAVDLLGDRRTAEASNSQQFAMTSINNLALLINEALTQLQNAKKNAKGGKGGKGQQKQGMQELQELQQQLNKTMQQARDKMQQGGNLGTAPKGQMSKEFAEMAQQQQAIRQALEKINKESNKDGKGALGNLNQMVKEMKQSEMDLVNKRITQETLNRQKNLLVKLLEAEKAQREQDEDAKLESQAAKQFPPSYQQMLEKFNRKLQSESELLRKLPPHLNYYYKNKVAEYFRLLNSPK